MTMIVTCPRFRSIIAVLSAVALGNVVEALPLDNFDGINSDNIAPPLLSDTELITGDILADGDRRTRYKFHDIRNANLRRHRWRPIECQLFRIDALAESLQEQQQLDLLDAALLDILTSYVCQIPDSPLDPFSVYTLKFDGETGMNDKAKLSSSDLTSIFSGNARLTLSNARIIDSTIIIHKLSDISITQDEDSSGTRRSLGMKSGVGTTLVVRVIDAAGRQAQQSAARLSDDFFGTKGDKVNLASQMAACSGGVLRYKPAEGVNIVGGVVEVTIDTNVTSYGPYYSPPPSLAELESKVMQTVNAKLGYNPETVFDFVAVVMPPDTAMAFRTTQVKAYAYPDKKRSIFRSNRASEVSVQVHEFGHNNGLSHSGTVADTYGDRTCMMGGRTSSDDGPRICYNAAKSKKMGWYARGEQEVPTKGYWKGKLVCIDDFLNNPAYNSTDHRVLAYIGDRFLMFNRAKGPTLDIEPVNADKVTVVQQTTPLTSQVTSIVQATLGSKESLIGVLPSGGGNFVIKVTNVDVVADPAFAEVIVYNSDLYWEDGIPITQSPSVSPSSSPSAYLSSSPTVFRSNSPSAVASGSPTTLVSASPTSVASASPTTDTSISPTTTASVPPSAAPVTASPTTTPTSSPTHAPTPVPTPPPSPPPTGTPSSSPSGLPTDAPVAPTGMPTTNVVEVLPMSVDEVEYLESALILRKVGTTIVEGNKSDEEINGSIQFWTDALSLTVGELRSEGADGTGGITTLYGIVPSGVLTVSPVDVMSDVVLMGPEEIQFLDSALTLRRVAKTIRSNGGSKTRLDESVVAWKDALTRTVDNLRNPGNGPIYLDGDPKSSEGTMKLFGLNF